MSEFMAGGVDKVRRREEFSPIASDLHRETRVPCNFQESPLVSICVPNYNNRTYLEERFQTILRQTYRNWEILVFDSGSTDGAWEYIVQLAGTEPRMRIWQGPREGVYRAWNECLRHARGKYVYIATSDDTMALDCIEKFVDALELHPECDIGHCGLRVIDECGREHAKSEWWRHYSVFARSSREWINHRHIRKAPLDGFLHLLGETVFTSITQLMIRRTLFERIGDFYAKWGAIGDLNWEMRATLVSNTIHVPDTWAAWRIHSAQATSDIGVGSPEHKKKVREMSDDALWEWKDDAHSEMLIALRQAIECRDMREAQYGFRNRMLRRYVLAKELMLGTEFAKQCLVAKLQGPEPATERDVEINWMLDCLAGVGVNEPLEVVSGSAK